MSRDFGKSSPAERMRLACGKTSGAASRAVSTALRPFSSMACGTTTPGSWSRCSRRSRKPRTLRADRAGEARRVGREARKDRGQIAGAQVARQELGAQIAEVGGHGHVPALEALRGVEPGPLSQDPASVHGAAQHQHGRRVPVIDARAAVFSYGATEL